MFLKSLVLVVVVVAAAVVGFSTMSANGSPEILYDFREGGDLAGWEESSDTAREVGMSKAALILQKTQLFQRAIFFTLLNPQPNGAGFAGVQNEERSWNLEGKMGLKLHLRAQGEADHFKVVLYHKHESQSAGHCAYEAVFSPEKLAWQDTIIPFTDFKPYYRGKECKDAPPLDRTDITSVGLQVAGGVYQPTKQKGASSLEIDYISTYSS